MPSVKKPIYTDTFNAHIDAMERCNIDREEAYREGKGAAWIIGAALIWAFACVFGLAWWLI